MLSELDNATVNTSVQTTFSANRSRGGLWALAVEPGVQHAQATQRGERRESRLDPDRAGAAPTRHLG